MPKPRLMIVSTYNALCGIASYTRALEKQLSPIFDIEISDVDQSAMRAGDPDCGDRQIRAICERMSSFDHVNLQYEPSIFGKNRHDIKRRVAMILETAPTLCVTMHTMMRPKNFPKFRFLSDAFRLKIGKARDHVADQLINRDLSTGIFTLFRERQKSRDLTLIAHTGSDAHYLRDAQGFRSVYDHPLSYFDRDDVNHIRATTSRASFPLLNDLQEDAVLVGVFGFIKPHKGFETVVKAMRLLPNNYYLLIFGGLHPQDRNALEPIHPYLRSLLDAGAPDPSDPLKQDCVWPRMRFMGALADDDFARAMTICDSVVLPYQETGQSASGVISIAVEIGQRVIAARNSTFDEFARYHDRSLEFFDVGNFVELAGRLKCSTRLSTPSDLTLNVESNRRLYVEAIIGRQQSPSQAAFCW